MKKPISARGLRHVLVLSAIFFVALVNSLAADRVPKAHKLQVTDPAVATRIVAGGGRLLADYGSYQLYEADTVEPGLLKASTTETRDEFNTITLNAGAIDTTKAETRALRKAVGTFTGQRLHLVQLVGPPRPEWMAEIALTGVEVVTYVPHNAYLIYGSAKSLAALQTLAESTTYIQWDGAYADDYKVHPNARTVNAKGLLRAVANTAYAIQMVDDTAENATTLALIDAHKTAPVRQQFKALKYLNVIVELPSDRVALIAARPEIVSIQPYAARRKFDERQNQIIAGNLSVSSPTGPGYLAWLASKGFTQSQFAASGFIVDVTDSGIDNGTSTPGHFGLYQSGSPTLASRVSYSRLEGRANPGSTRAGCDGHGNLNAHIIAGFNDRSGFPHTDALGYRYGLGVCPFVKVGSSVIFDPANFTDPNYFNLQARAYSDGARVSANSWGADTAGDYDVDAQSYDALVRDAQPANSVNNVAGNQEMVIVFAAGNAGPNSSTVGSPGTAKNIICVGAAENVHPHATSNGGNNASGNDGCTTPDGEADSANDIASFSSRGPCSDGRKKPDIVAPGTHVTGGVAQSSTSTNGTGSAISCFSGEGVCALPGGGTAGSTNNFFPLGQQFFTTSSGTSHSTPAIAGACALIRQNFINSALTVPSAAMTKAFLLNSARYMNGVSANDTLPSNNQGLGEANLGMAFDGVARLLRDQLPGDKFTASGQTRTINGVITDPTKPLRVTLAWTDAPGNTTGSAYNNNLDLVVTVGGNTYKGNVFTGANSTTGGAADFRNNVESIFLPAGVSGNVTVTVSGTSINSDGVPGDVNLIDQDFALVIYNATPANGPVIVSVGASLNAESCVSPNNAVDPSETVTMNFALQNFGNVNTINLVATLLATGGVTAPGAAQNYGALLAGGASVTQTFTFTATGACGSNLVATLSLTDGTTNLGVATFTIPIGSLSTIFTQNFDSVTAPALPAGWTTSAGGSESPWVTVTAVNDTAPNAAFSPAPGSTGSNQLVSATITLLPGASQLTFRHRHQFETDFDGGVLEMRIGGGAFADIIDASGAFVGGGYTHTLDAGNPLGARQGWSGTNSVFSTVIVALPPSAAGQNVQFRWRAATDFSVAGGGWWVDSVAVQGSLCCGGSFAPIVTAQPQSQTISLGDAAGFSISAIGANPLSFQWFFNSSPIPNATNGSYNLVSATTNDAGNYFAVVTNASGFATSAVASLTVIVAPPGSTGSYSGILAGWNVSAQTSYGPSPLAPTTNAPNISVVGLTRGVGVTTGGTAAARAWGGNGFDAASASAAVTANDVATFSISASAGYKVSFSAVSRFDYRRSGSGPPSGVLQVQVGAGAFVDVATNSYSSSSGSGASLAAIDLSTVAALQNVGPGINVTFRIANYAANSSGGNWYVYDVANTAAPDFAVTGTVTPLVTTLPPAAAPVFSLTTVASNQIQFTISGTAGSNYVVDVSTNLPGNWTPTHTGAAPILLTRPATNAQQFFRARVAP